MRTLRWRLTRRYGPALAVSLAAAGAALNSSTSSASVTDTSPVPRASASASTDGRSSADGEAVRSLYDRWRPGRRDGGETPDGANCGLAGECSTGAGAAGAGAARASGGAATGEDTGEPAGESADAGPGPAGSQTTPASPWTPPTPLPGAAADSRRVVVVLSPHPDDETLSFGVWIADAAAHGDRVIVISLTDGRSTGAIGAVSLRLGRTVTRDEIAAARIRELQQATSLLGIAPGDVYRAQLDGNRTPGGTRVTVDETEAVIAAFAERFPQATFATMSWLAERHPDHLNAGRALSAAATDGRVAYAEFAVSRLWWALPSPACADVLPTSPAVRRRVAAAAEAYERWDPAHQRYAVGWLSVHAQFTELIADPRTRLHGADAGAGPVRTRDRRSAL